MVLSRELKNTIGLNVGGGLPPIAVCQPIHLWLTDCNRGQAPPTFESHSALAVEFLQKHSHLFLCLLIAMGLGRFNPLLPR